jgi:putative ABC transport system permease protein
LKHIDFKETRVLLTALPLATYRRHTEITLTSANPEVIDQVLNRDARAVLVSDNFAIQHGLGVGNEVTLPTIAGRLPWRIVGTVQNYSWNRGTIIIDRDVYKKWLGDTLVDQFDIFLEPGVDPATIQRQIEESVGPEHDLVVLTNASLREHILKMLRHFYVLIYANAFMAMTISFLGVANTLAISVLQRKRELGLLRAVGATRWQVAWSVIAQALLIGILGLLLGVGLGILLQQYVLQVLMVEETGYYFAFLFPFMMSLVTAAFAVTAAQAAAAVPAARAARLQISEAVAYE